MKIKEKKFIFNDSKKIATTTTQGKELCLECENRNKSVNDTVNSRSESKKIQISCRFEEGKKRNDHDC